MTQSLKPTSSIPTEDYLIHLRDKCNAIRIERPKWRNRALAEALGISEAELLTLDLEEGVTRLTTDFKGLLGELAAMGKIMALTRNEAVVHERKGIYENVSFYDGHMQMGVAVNPDIDLRFFMGRWAYGLAVEMDRGENMPRLFSFQFFDQWGRAVHKVFSTKTTDIAAYHNLVSKYTEPEQVPIFIEDREIPAAPQEKPDSEIDVAGFGESWKGLQDTHDFFPMMRKFGVQREQALRLAPAGKVTPVDRLSVESVLEAARDGKVPIMCFVHSHGCIQIHTGEVNNLKWHGDWFNVLDPSFNLHLDTTHVARCYVVRKPTADGVVTSLELFSAAGELLVYFFGARKPGIPELADWTQILEKLPASA